MFKIRGIVCIICLVSLCQVAGATEPQYQKLYREGVEANKKGDLDQAIRRYSEAIALKPSSAPLYFVRGRALREKGDLDRAIADLTKAITLKPDYAEAYNHRGVAYIGKQKPQQALADFKKACSLGSREGCANAAKATGK